MIHVFGSYCHDVLRLESAPAGIRALGGSAAYLGATLRALGQPFVVTSPVGEDFRYPGDVPAEPLVRGPTTAEFVTDLRVTPRRMILARRGPALGVADLPARIGCALVAGVAGEIGSEVYSEILARADVVLVDAQAVLREFHEGGEVRLRRWGAGDGVPAWLKASEEEAERLPLAELRRGGCRVVVTRGAAGALYLDAERELTVAPVPVTERDPTGAGDAFLAGLALGIARGWAPESTLALAAACGAWAVTQAGVPRGKPPPYVRQTVGARP